MKIIYTILNIFHIICWFIGIFIISIILQNIIKNDCTKFEMKLFNQKVIKYQSDNCDFNNNSNK